MTPMYPKDAEFWAVPKSVLSINGLSLEAKLVYAVLFTRTNGDNVAWPSQKYIAAALAIGERSVRRYIRELVDKRLITVERLGLKRTNRYSLTGQVGRSRTATVGRSHSKRTKKERNNNNRTCGKPVPIGQILK